MSDKENFKSKIVLAIVFCFCASITVSGQTDAEKKYEIFQNQQRALALSFYKNSIKLLEDAPMRCFARKQIAEFIFSKKVKEYFDTAETFAVECLEDIAKNPKQFTSSSNYISGEIIYLLRANSPELAKKVEKKYSASKTEAEFADFIEANSAKDMTSLVNKVVSDIRKGKLPSDTNFIIHKTSQKNPELVSVLLESLISHYENLPITEDFDHHLVFNGHQFLKDSTPIDIKKRYLHLTVRLGQAAVSVSANSKLFSTAGLLGSSLPVIKEILPALYPQALAIRTTLLSKESQAVKEEREIYKRIEESENKLEQTIIEAEAAENKNLKYGLWVKAAELALKEKKFHLSVEYINKFHLSVEYINKFESSNEEFNKRYKVQFLTHDVLIASLKEKDFEAADFAVENVEDLIGKAFGLIRISTAHSESGNHLKALTKLNDALSVLDKADNDIHKVRNLLSAASLASKIENADAFEITNAAIRTINRLPILNPDDQLETETRNEYVGKVLLPNAYNLNRAFKILAEKDVDFAYPISQGIQRKDLRLIAEIVIEMHKNYPVIPENKNN